jgi:hypothetical protein
VDDITAAIADLTDRVIAYRVLFFSKGRQMDRLKEKLAKAAGVAQRQTTKIEARADALIAREDAIEQRTHAVFEPHERIVGDAEKGLDAVERALGQMSNAPLQDSGSSPEVEQAPATFQDQ